MKTAIFKGNPYHVPNWAKYLAEDGDGLIYAFEMKPLRDAHGQWYSEVGECAFVGNVNCIAIV